jgi:hypothetical protein
MILFYDVLILLFFIKRFNSTNFLRNNTLGLDLNDQTSAVTKYPEYLKIPEPVIAQFIPNEEGQLGGPYTCQDFISINLRLPSSSDSVKTIGIATMFPVFHPVCLF